MNFLRCLSKVIVLQPANACTAFSYTWSNPFTRQRWRSRHSIRHSRQTNDTLKHGSVFYRTRLTGDRSFTLREFSTFCSCDLDLDPMTFIYEFDSYFLEIHWMCNMNFVFQGFESYGLTDRQTDTTEIPRRFVAGHEEYFCAF